MPRVKLATPKHEGLSVLLYGHIKASGKTHEEIATQCKMSVGTFNRRLKKPEQLTAEELGRFGRALAIPIEELRLNAIRY